MSGLSEIELAAFQDWAATHPTELTLPLLHRAQRLFEALGPAAIQRLRDLETTIPPPVPELPDGVHWSAEEWLAWGTEEYLPYFTWVIHQNQPRDWQMKLGQQFGEWLVSAYPDLLMDPSGAVITRHFDAIRSTPHEVVLWLVVDGLSWWEGKSFIRGATRRHLDASLNQPYIWPCPRSLQCPSERLYRDFWTQTVGVYPYAPCFSLDCRLKEFLARSIPIEKSCNRIKSNAVPLRMVCAAVQSTRCIPP